MAPKADKTGVKRKLADTSQQALTAEEQKHLRRMQDQGDLKLLFDDGKALVVGSQPLAFASPFFAGLFGDAGKPSELKVEFTQLAWEKLLLRVYNIFPRPKLTMASILTALVQGIVSRKCCIPIQGFALRLHQQRITHAVVYMSAHCIKTILPSNPISMHLCRCHVRR